MQRLQTASIRQNPQTSALPDFASFAVYCRIILASHACGLLGVLLRYRDFKSLGQDLGEMLLRLEPLLLLTLLIFYLLRQALRRMPYRYGIACLLFSSLFLAMLVEFLLVEIRHMQVGLSAYLITLSWTALAVGLQLAYFSYLHKLRAPAFSEARLMALTARIRPHFLFNSLNAVLGVIRSDPRRAEAALEELAELFRALMRENRELTPLSEEIALARQYLNLERLRLGERLQVIWDIESCPPDTLVPPLMLQPLLENAVYHGIEPSSTPGTVHISLGQRGDRVRIELTNPCAHSTSHTRGSQIALSNIRERLELFFGMDAVLAAGERSGNYHVVIDIPFFAKEGGR